MYTENNINKVGYGHETGRRKSTTNGGMKPMIMLLLISLSKTFIKQK